MKSSSFDDGSTTVWLEFFTKTRCPCWRKRSKGRVFFFSWPFSAPVLLPHVANNSTQCFLLDLDTLVFDCQVVQASHFCAAPAVEPWMPPSRQPSKPSWITQRSPSTPSGWKPKSFWKAMAICASSKWHQMPFWCIPKIEVA